MTFDAALTFARKSIICPMVPRSLLQKIADRTKTIYPIPCWKMLESYRRFRCSDNATKVVGF